MAEVKPVADGDFDQQVLKSAKPVLVDFWAEWCGPCRMVAPVVQELATELAGKLTVLKMNVDENPETAARYQVMSIPTLAVFKGGELQDKLIGYRPKAQLAEEVARSL